MQSSSDHAAIARSQREVVGLLAASASVPAPASLHDRVMAATMAARAAGHVAGAPPAISSAEAFARIVDDFERLLDDLSGSDWDREVAEYGWTVKQMIAHLTVIDDYLAVKFGIADRSFDPQFESDHVEMTRADVEAAALSSISGVVNEWRRSSSRLVTHARGLSADDLQGRISFHGLDVRRSSALLIRVFEIWTHADDIRRAVGRPMESPTPDVLQPMARMAVPAIPLGMLLRQDSPTGLVARLVLTGAGGGTFDQPLGFGEQAGTGLPAPSVLIVTDVVDFCRLASQRVAAVDLDVEFEGDADLGRRVLAGAAVFAA